MADARTEQPGRVHRRCGRPNLLFILSAEHSRDVSGCYGHPIVKTPNIDKFAVGATMFTDAYTNCQICVPARASAPGAPGV